MNHPGSAAAPDQPYQSTQNSENTVTEGIDQNTSQSPDQLLDLAVSLAKDDMLAVDQTIRRRLDSDIALIRTLGAYVVKSGGKRMRPLILLLCARACGYQGDQHITLAAMVETDLMAVMQIMSSTTNAIAEGEVLQLLNAHSPDTTEQAYLDTIHRKTAKLFESAAWLGGIVSGQDEKMCHTLSQYGVYLGTAFQLVDDVMDYLSTSEEMGKEVGDDLAEGKPTLPLIQAMANGTPEQIATVRKAIENGERERITEILQIVHATGAIDYTMECARAESQKAIRSIESLPDSDYKQALINLALFSVARNH